MGVRRKRPQQAVELNLAAMLDMAFQLLAFFILTFRPTPIEGTISLLFPPAAPIAAPKSATASPSTPQDVPIDEPLKESISIRVSATPNGLLGGIAINEQPVTGLAALDTQLKTIVQDPSVKFEQVVIEVSPDLVYRELMKVIDVCIRQQLPDGRNLDKLNIVPLRGNVKR